MRRLARLAEGNTVTIAQKDGSVKRFPESDLKTAFANLTARMRGEDVPEHPLLTAARNSPDPKWSRSFYSATGATEPAADLWE